MQINRLIEIVFILLKKEKISAKVLSERFEVSTRTIYRDIDTLSYAGIPVITDKGNGGGICIEESFRIKNTFLSEQEQNEILMLLNSQLITNNHESGKILNKLSAVFDKSANNYIEIDFTSWQNREGDADKFKLLKTAITQRRKISFGYYSTYKGYGIKEVEPLKLVFKHISWYLYSYSLKDNDYRLYKLNRIINPNISDELFTRKIEKQNVAKSIEWKDKMHDVEIEFDKSVISTVYDYFSPHEITHYEDKVIVRSQIPINEFVASIIISYGDKAKVSKPQMLIEIIKNTANSVLNIYK